MDFFTFIVVLAAIGAGSSVLSSIAGAIKPKIRKKDIEVLKEEIKRDLGGEDAIRALPDVDTMCRRLNQLEDQVSLQGNELDELREENRFLKRLLDSDST